MIPSGKFDPQAVDWKKVKLVIWGGIGVISFIAMARCQELAQVARDSAPTYDSATSRAAAEQLVRQRLRDPSSAEFSDVVVHPGTATGSTIVCGRVNARNGFGGMSGSQRFIAGGEVSLEDEIGAESMNELWARHC